jgi:hypothetical protein
MMNLVLNKLADIEYINKYHPNKNDRIVKNQQQQFSLKILQK